MLCATIPRHKQPCALAACHLPHTPKVTTHYYLLCAPVVSKNLPPSIADPPGDQQSGPAAQGSYVSPFPLAVADQSISSLMMKRT